MSVTTLLFGVGFYMAARNWKFSRHFRDEGLALMALSSVAFLISSHAL